MKSRLLDGTEVSRRVVLCVVRSGWVELIRIAIHALRSLVKSSDTNFGNARFRYQLVSDWGLVLCASLSLNKRWCDGIVAEKPAGQRQLGLANDQQAVGVQFLPVDSLRS